MKTIASVEEDCRKNCEHLCKVIGEAIGDRTISFEIKDDFVRLDYTFGSMATMSKKFQSIEYLDIYLRGMWDMYLSRRWIRG